MKTTLYNINLQLKGDGLTFWAYNMTGDLTNFAVVLTQGGVKYEAQITLTLGEAVYTIPWTEFKNGENSVDARLEIEQIDFTKSAKTTKYYLDEIGFYSVAYEHVYGEFKPEYFDIDGYDEIYLVVSFNGEEYTLRDPQYIIDEDRWVFSDNLAHKCCKLAGIRSKTKRGRKIAGRENIKFPNIIKGNWNATKPLEIVVSDMTCIKHKGIRWEWTYLLDVFNNEIIASSVTNKVGSSLPYYHCLEYLIEKKKEQTYPVILHTDQGSVYSSTGFYQTHKDYTNIIRSMSRAGTPTDNPIIESLNG